MLLKIVAAAIMVLLFAGCEPPQSKEFATFVEEHGAGSYQYCSKEGFLTEEEMASNYSKVPLRNLVRDNTGSPVRCAVGINGEIYE